MISGKDLQATFPRVSVGLPVYNGANYVKDAVNSVLDQTFTDFELIISDNASNDRTEEICRAYTEKDSRVRYYRNPDNVGIVKNYNITFELSSGEYFKWLAHDDVLAPEYLERCVKFLDENPDVVLCHTWTYKIQADGKVTDRYEEDQFVTSKEPNRRFFDAICVPHQVVVGHALIRSSVLRKTHLLGPYPGCDYSLQGELALVGRLYQIPEYLFYRRSHPGRAYRVPIYERIALEDPTKAGKIVLPAWLQWFDYFRAVMRAPISGTEKIRCMIQIIRTLRRGRMLYPLLRDLKWGIKQIISRLIFRRSKRYITAGKSQSKEGI